jgi:hypothetical protein
LDELAMDLVYPVVEQIEGLIQQPDIDCRNQQSCSYAHKDPTHRHRFTIILENFQPGDYPTYVHIGNLRNREDGILYGFYETQILSLFP